MNQDNQKCFIKVTNQMIYEKLIAIEDKISKHSGMLRWHSWAIGFIILIIVSIIARIR